LKSEPQINKKWVLQEFENFQFPKHISHGILLYAGILVHVFHCIHSLGVFLLNDADLKRENTEINQNVQLQDWPDKKDPTLPKAPLPMARRIWKWSKSTAKERKELQDLSLNLNKKQITLA